MELMTKQGYKQTEVGLIPEDWDAKRIGDIALIERGKFTPRPRNNPIYYGGEIPFVQTGDVTRCNGKISHYSQTLNKIGLGVSKLFPKGSILMTIAANIGYTGVLQIDMACPDSLIGINGKQVENEFLNFYFQFRRNEIEELSTSGAQKNLNIELFRPFLIPLPPTLTEQKAIATALSDVDALISSLEQTLTKKKAIKQGALQQLLIVTEDWITKTIKEVATYRRGSFPQPYGLAKWYDDISGMPFVQVVDVAKNKKLKAETKQKISAEGAKMSVFVKKGSVILTIQGSIGRICITQYDAYVDRTLLIFESFKEDFNTYFFMILIWLKFQIEKEKAPGGIIKTITKEALSSFEISFPNREKQDRIAEVLEDIEKEINLLETKKEKYQAIKQGMMQELLTGKTRLI
jgi:type I restriction enzyme S subunit